MHKLLWIFSLCVCFTACKKTPKYDYNKLSGFTQGTSYHITYENNTGKDYSLAVDSLLQAFSKSLSTYDSTSVISGINLNKPNAKADELFIKVFRKAKDFYDLSGGAFDITVGPLVNAWGFGPPGPQAKIDTTQIPALLQLVGMNRVHLQGNTVVKDNPNIRIDVNAIAQGFSVDYIADYFENEGVKNYMVEIGGEVRTKGKNAKGEYWRIGVDKPLDNNSLPGQNLQAILQLNNKSISTSGNYRKFYERNGVKYAHTINPKTGFPAKNNLLSATVLADDCTTADALATTFMVLGLDKSIELLKKLKHVEVFFIYNDANGNYQQYFSKGMKKRVLQDEK
jgi:thiamine biosynthesis lipoprotein